MVPKLGMMKAAFSFSPPGSMGMSSASFRQPISGSGRQDGSGHGGGKGHVIVPLWSARKGTSHLLFTKKRWEAEQAGPLPPMVGKRDHGGGQYIDTETVSRIVLRGSLYSQCRSLTVARKFRSLLSGVGCALEPPEERDWDCTRYFSSSCCKVWNAGLSRIYGVDCVTESWRQGRKRMSSKTTEQSKSHRLSSRDRSLPSATQGKVGPAILREHEIQEVIKKDPDRKEATSKESSSNAVELEDQLWLTIREEARRDSEAEPVLASFLYSTILAHPSLERALAFHIANKLSSTTLLSTQLYTLIADTFMEDADIRAAVHADLQAVKSRDPACVGFSHCLLNFKGFLACQSHRIAHRLWNQGRIALAFALQSRVSEVFHVDFHPAATVGHGVLFDHATGVVVGETAQIGNNVSILHHVTLGGTGASGGIRHPKVGDGVLIGAGATVLGPVKIGEGAKIGAGSVVLTDIPAHCTAVGNPARLIGGKHPAQLKEMPSENMDHTSFITHWSDYII